MTSQSHAKASSLQLSRLKSLSGEEVAFHRVKMCKIRTLRELENQQPSTAVEEIFGLFETTLAEYEEEIDHQHRLLEVVEKAVNQIYKAGL